MREMLMQTLYNLRYDMDCIGCEEELYEELGAMSITELENLISSFLDEM